MLTKILHIKKYLTNLKFHNLVKDFEFQLLLMALK